MKEYVGERTFETKRLFHVFKPFLFPKTKFILYYNDYQGYNVPINVS